MLEPFIGAIIIFAGNFQIRGWAFCSGQILSIAQNTALFSILGTTYGGNGQTTFALPDLRGRTPIHFGQGPGLSPYSLGQLAGTETQTLLSTQIPAHTHTITIPAVSTAGNTNTPAPANSLATLVDSRNNPLNLYSNATANTSLGSSIQASITGSSQPVSIMQPYLALNYLIALEGIFPSRN